MPTGRLFYLEAAKLLDKSKPNYRKMLFIYMKNYVREMNRDIANLT